MHLLSPSTGMPTTLATLLLLAVAGTTEATMAAWWTELGPQVILQNDTTGLIQYSACNSQGQPQYSGTDESTFSLQYKPKKGTPLGGAGYLDEDTMPVASIYYLDKDNNIVNALFNCNMTTGHFEGDGSWVISSYITPLPIANNSGLTTLLLGPKAGYRVYYHDENMAVNELAYTTVEGWQYNALISQDRQGSPAIAAAFSAGVKANANISVSTARDAENIEVTRFQNDSTWRITTFPHPLEGDLTTMETAPDDIKINTTAQANFTLPAWKGRPGALGMSIDKNYTRSVWYIGEDKSLYWVANKQWVWGHQNSQQAEIWPLADSPNAPLAVASDYKNDMLRIYYLVDGKVVEIKNDKGEWKEWSTLPAPQPAIAKPPPSPSSPGPVVEDDTNGGLSNGVKIGLGVGISLVVLTIAAISAAIFMLRRKRSPSTPGFEAGAALGPDEYKPIGSLDSPSTQYSTHGAPPGSAGYDHYVWDMKSNGELVHPPHTAGIFQLDATGRPVELDSPQVRYELSDQPASHELMGEGLGPVHRPSR